jgi:hypothetical protein
VLKESSKLIMADYTLEKAVEGRRTGSKDSVLQGLIPVVMAGGRADTRTGGMLLAVLLHSAQKTGLKADQIFAEGARFATDPQTIAQIRDFPSLTATLSAIERFGYHERSTAEGVTYEHHVEALFRPKWYDWILKRRRRTYEEVEMENRKRMDSLDRGRSG